MSLADQNDLDVSELSWTYDWLVRTKKEEVEAIENANKGK